MSAAKIDQPPDLSFGLFNIDVKEARRLIPVSLWPSQCTWQRGRVVSWCGVAWFGDDMCGGGVRWVSDLQRQAGEDLGWHRVSYCGESLGERGPQFFRLSLFKGRTHLTALLGAHP